MTQPIAVGASDPSQLATPTPEQRTQNAVALLGGQKPAAVGVAQGGVVPPAEKPAVEVPKPQPAFKDAVAKMREERQKRQQEQAQEAQYLQENRRLTQELEALKAHPSFEDDPVGYAQARKWTKDQQLTYGQALLYDLAPDQADPNFRVSMFEQKQAREKAREREAAEAAKVQAATEAQKQEFQRYTASMEEAVMSFDAGSYPESEDWYGDDVQSYLRDMLSTAFKMSEAANKAGTVVDLTPPAVAAKLEADRAAKAAARDKRRAMRNPSDTAGQRQQSPVGTGAEQSAIDTTSSKNLSGGGAPLPPATSEAERIQRAVAAGFRNR